MESADELARGAPGTDAEAPAETRRGILSMGLKLAVAAPTALVALQGGVALAHPGPKGDQDSNDDSDNPGRGNGKNFPKHAPAFSLHLCRVGDIGNQGTDFPPTNGGSDPLAAGVLRVVRGASGQNARVWVDVNGANANTTYEVFFDRFNDHGREDVGGFKTGPGGHFRGFTSGSLGGKNRVGVFVIQNGSSDEFVTCFPT